MFPDSSDPRTTEEGQTQAQERFRNVGKIYTATTRRVYTGCGRPDNYHYKRFDRSSPEYERRRSVFVRLDAEACRQKGLDYYYGNRPSCLITAGAYRAANREQYREWNAAWYEKNKESVKERQRANRKAKRRKARIESWQELGKLTRLVKDLSVYGSVLTVWINSEDRSVTFETKYVGVEVAQSGTVRVE